jgi:beta-galactosidase
VHSNLDEVELFLNGQSQGRQRVQPLTHLEWKVKYEPGTIEAHGSRNGRVVLTTKRETTGKPEAIRLSSDRTEINANGEDVAIVQVEVLDGAGLHVPTANDLISFKVQGEGLLIGVGNGDPNCQESDKEPRRRLFNGLAQVLLQANKTSGTIVLEAYAEESLVPKLRAATLTIKTNKCELRPSV